MGGTGRLGGLRGASVQRGGGATGSGGALTDCVARAHRPGLFFSTPESDHNTDDDPCASLVSDANLTSCADLKACLDAQIAAGKLRAWNVTADDDDDAAPAAPAGLSVYFAFCYFLYYLCGHTGTNIPCASPHASPSPPVRAPAALPCRTFAVTMRWGWS